MNQLIKYLGIALISLFMVSCSKSTIGEVVVLPKKKSKELMAVLSELSNQEYDYFYSKIATKYKDSTQSVSFKLSARVIADTATNALITFARIPFINIVLTEDSITYTDKSKKCYSAESLSSLKEQFAVDFSLKNIEELLIGLPLAYDSKKKYFQLESNNGNYIMCSHSKRDLKKIDKGQLDAMVLCYTLSKDASQLESISLVRPREQTEITIDYRERQLIDGYLLPKKVDVRIFSAQGEVTIDMDYKKMRINQIESIHFIIPENYGVCE